MRLELLVKYREKSNAKWWKLKKAQLRAQTGDPMYDQQFIDAAKKEFEEAHLRWLITYHMCFPKQLITPAYRTTKEHIDDIR